jgi:hypothetical protein
MRGVTQNSILQTSTNFFCIQTKMNAIPQTNEVRKAILGFTLSDPFLLTVGKPPCLVILCPKSPRRDKVCPLYRVRNWGCTNMLQTPQKLYGHVKNAYSTSPLKNEDSWTASSFTIAHSRNERCYMELKSTQALLGFILVWPFPSYSWKATLFGHIVSKIPEAWQSVSTISRSKLRLHKHAPNPTKTIWACREHLPHLTIQKWSGLDRLIFHNRQEKRWNLKRHVSQSVLNRFSWSLACLEANE